MPIYTIAEYRVKATGVNKVRHAIEEFVTYVRTYEPGTRMYAAWQKKDDPTKFLHFFIFEDKAAHAAHASSNAVKRFEAAYRPELQGGDVVFTDYELVAAKS
jgi:quinol monooxygenase YgiN